MPNDVSIDYIHEGVGYGSFAAQLVRNNFDPYAMRPYTDDRGKGSYITTLGAGGKPEHKMVSNAPASLRHEEWLLIDEQVIRVATPSMRVFNDLRANSPYVIPNGLSKTMLMHERMGDISPATITMNPSEDVDMLHGGNDAALFDQVMMPLPIIHKTLFFDARDLAVSRNGNTPLDTTNVTLATRRVSEVVEQLTLGTWPHYKFAGSYVYGYTNFPQRLTFSLASPLSSGWTPAVFVDQVLQMQERFRDQNFDGPWMMYVAPSWNRFLDADFKTYANQTLRQRVMAIDGISGIRTASYLRQNLNTGGTGWTVLMVQMTPDVVQAVVGMDMMVVHWTSPGGFRDYYKVMCMLLPRVRCDQNNQTGIMQADVGIFDSED